jgi:hypothetical protein
MAQLNEILEALKTNCYLCFKINPTGKEKAEQKKKIACGYLPLQGV